MPKSMEGEGRRHRISRSVPVKNLNLDVSKISSEALMDIASTVETEVRETLERLLGPRILRYSIAVTAELQGEQLVISVDTSISSRVPPSLRLEHIVDRAIKRGFDKVEVLLRRRYSREASEGGTKQES